jgi:tRNA pseudouridine38-40 synthase
MPRYVADIRFKGTAYSGWQIQANSNSVQAEVDRVLTMVLRVPIACYGAGRTDTGVHAIKLPAHFDYGDNLHPSFFKAVNAILPNDIAITRVYKATDDDFHCRFHAIGRAYIYKMIFQKDPLRHGLTKWIKEKVDVDAMQRGAQILLEYEDFASFHKTRGSQKTTLCTIHSSFFEWEGDTLCYHIKANRFLRGMVRTIIGTLLLMGKGDLNEAQLRKIIEAKDRRHPGPAELADGLYLSEVYYKPGSLEEILF